MASEGKQAEEKSDHDEFDILKKVARFFQRKRDDNAMYGGDKNGGLESVFEDFCDSHADEFVTEMKEDGDGKGFSHSLRSLHEGYLAEFEKSCEWAIEVEGGDPKIFYAQCERALIRREDSASLSELGWFLDAMFAAMDIVQFHRIMSAKAESRQRRK
mmetsp:Transcript_67185/g.135396  ORF Transcript_67185/g.135396 Transcript_67185/m.135396 type:complete len:158 (+) Transcript_67185:235-708(+)